MSENLRSPAIPSLQDLMFAKPLAAGFWPGGAFFLCHNSPFFVLLKFPLFYLFFISFALCLLLQVPCLRNGAATTFNLGDLHGKFVLLLFQPVDFGYIGPTELELLDDLGSDCEVFHHID